MRVSTNPRLSRKSQTGVAIIEHLLLLALIVVVGLAGVPPFSQAISSLLTLPGSGQASIGLVSRGPAIGN